jgi:predicted dehydrogenase
MCEKPLAGSLADAEAMVAAAEKSDRVTAVGWTYRRSPAVEAIRRELAAGTLGELIRFNGHYWCDYELDPTSPITWRYRGGQAPVRSPTSAVTCWTCRNSSAVDHRSQWRGIRHADHPTAGVTYGRTKSEVSHQLAAVENEDVATFTARFNNGAVGTFAASRVAHNLPDGLAFELFASQGSASWDLHRAGEFQLVLLFVSSIIGRSSTTSPTRRR